MYFEKLECDISGKHNSRVFLPCSEKKSDVYLSQNDRRELSYSNCRCNKKVTISFPSFSRALLPKGRAWKMWNLFYSMKLEWLMREPFLVGLQHGLQLRLQYWPWSASSSVLIQYNIVVYRPWWSKHNTSEHTESFIRASGNVPHTCFSFL